MEINTELISGMSVFEIVQSLTQDDEYLVEHTIPKSSPEDIRDELIMQYNKLTNSNIRLNKCI